MTICSICKKITATNEDHLDCKEKRRIELEDQNLKRNAPEQLNSNDNTDDLGVEVKAILEHMNNEKEKTE